LESFQPHLLKIVISSSLSSPLLWWLCISLNLLNHRLSASSLYHSFFFCKQAITQILFDHIQLMILDEV
jgi:hypothetical protein